MSIKIGAIAALFVGCVSLAAPAQAAVYDFFFTAEPADNSDIVFTSDASLRAIGTIEIDAEDGAAFDVSSLIDVAINVTADTIPGFTVTELQFLNGSVSEDGASISLTDIATPFANVLTRFFGCVFESCGNASAGLVGVQDGDVSLDVAFVNGTSALDSLKVTRSGLPPSAVPLPAGLPLVLSGLGLLGLVRRRKG
ncbi:PEP-CTERM sorting domain-containing protein [uncultured Jannaschia sp.]|uniref:PEP-CTERM sorting domain-containing protein n=1 Tax=uncultured Jannaschia sp. TaxID=293347 RepID=UPI002631CA47|nr:PEP-CTERM sorting domain-containing protein [uncultured Jannaschia sp.]